jgi:hypothetical protein
MPTPTSTDDMPTPTPTDDMPTPTSTDDMSPRIPADATSPELLAETIAWNPILWNEHLSRIMSLNPRSNRFQPSESQVNQLLESQRNGSLPRYNQMRISEWLNAVRDAEFLFPWISYIIRQDEEQRANAWATELVAYWNSLPPSAVREFIMLDGHGRLFYLILRALHRLLGSEIDSIRIHVPDLDSTVTEWHQAFFPAGVSSTQEDIYTVVARVGASCYYNFCALGDAARGLIPSLRFLGERGMPAMVSYTARGIAILDEGEAPRSEIMAIHHAFTRSGSRIGQIPRASMGRRPSEGPPPPSHSIFFDALPRRTRRSTPRLPTVPELELAGNISMIMEYADDVHGRVREVFVEGDYDSEERYDGRPDDFRTFLILPRRPPIVPPELPILPLPDQPSSTDPSPPSVSE